MMANILLTDFTQVLYRFFSEKEISAGIFSSPWHVAQQFETGRDAESVLYNPVLSGATPT